MSENRIFSVRKISRFKEFEIDQIIEIQRICNLSRWSRLDYQLEPSRSDSLFLIAENRDRPSNSIIGFILLRINPINTPTNLAGRYKDADLLNFGVTVNSQKQGIGGALFKNARLFLSNLGVHSIWLEVRELNFNARNFYEKNGFITVQIRKNFYTQPIDNAVLMKLEM